MILSTRENGELHQHDIDAPVFDAHYDVIVAGLGTAGSIALVTAARLGLQALGIDRMHCMGGMGTAGSVNGYYFGTKGGVYEEVDAQVAELIGTVYTRSSAYNVDAKKYKLEQLATADGAALAYESTVTAVYLEGKQVVGLQWIGPEGLQSASCKVVIDCTGDAEVCALAGCDTSFGRALDGRAQPFTSVKVFAAGDKVSWRNFDSGCTDQTDARTLTESILHSHAQHLEETYGDGQRLLHLAPLLGIREGRLIHGEETLSLAAYFEDLLPQQPLFYAYADVDKHGRDHAFESQALQDWFVASNLGAVNISVPVSLGMMTPKGYDGLLAAGRCLAVDHDLSTCVRMNRDMQKSGEAAATAAKLAIDGGVPLQAVPYEQLRDILQETGCYNPEQDRGYQIAYPAERKPDDAIEWQLEPASIHEGLASDRPGIAIWSCRRLGQGMRAQLLGWLDEPDEQLRRHSALALGLIGERASLPLLRQMIRERDHYALKDCRKNNQMRGYMAIYLAARLQDAEVVEELIQLVTDPNEIDRPRYQAEESGNRGKTQKYNDVYYQFFSHATIGLLRIGAAHPHLRDSIAQALRQAVGDRGYIKRITQLPFGTYEYSIADNIQSVVEQELGRWETSDGAKRG